MPRRARVTVAGAPHPVVRGGHNRPPTLFAAGDDPNHHYPLPRTRELPENAANRVGPAPRTDLTKTRDCAPASETNLQRIVTALYVT